LGRAKAFRFSSLQCKTTSHPDAHGNSHLLLQNGFSSVQLLVKGHVDLTKKFYLTFHVEGPERLPVVERASRQLDTWMRGQTAEPGAPWLQYDDRLRHYVIALNGHLAGRSYRDIAEVIYGTDRVKSVWTSDTRYLKEGMRRAVRRGLEYMNGEYRSLL
jgi:Uncharacterized conserved protein (DUF2285)